MAEKIYLTSEDLYNDALQLAVQILNSGFKPEIIIALWRGGTPIGIAVQEFMDYYGQTRSDHISIRTSSYSGIEDQSRQVKIHGLNYLVKNMNQSDSLLIVDDVFDTGRTIQALINEIESRCRKNTPHDIRIAVPWYKPAKNETDRVPDYFIHTTSQWLKFPFSLEGLTIEEIKHNRPEIYNIIKPALDQLPANS